MSESAPQPQPLDKRAIWVGIGSAVAAALIVSIINYWAATTKKGLDANTRELIHAEIDDRLKLDNGNTYGQELSQIGNRLTAIETSQEAMSDDVREIRNAVVTMAGGN